MPPESRQPPGLAGRHAGLARYAGFVLALALGVASAHATQIVPLSIEATIRQADAVVVGTVTSQQSRWGDASRRWMQTDYILDVEDVLHPSERGNGIGRTMRLTYWGGTLEGESQRVADVHPPAVGEHVVLVLHSRWAEGTSDAPTVGFDYGLFIAPKATASEQIVRDAAGRPLLMTGEGRIVRGSGAARGQHGEKPVDLAAFKAWLRANIAAIKAAPVRSKAAHDPGDPRVMRTRAKTPVLPKPGERGAVPGTARSRSPAMAAAPASPNPAKAAHGEGTVFAATESLSRPDGRKYSSSHQAYLPIVISNFPDSFTPWSPEDEYQMSKWNHYADVFRVYTTPLDTYGWPDGVFDLAGWPSDADRQRVYGSSWYCGEDCVTLGVTVSRYDSGGWIVEADVLLNPSVSWTLDDEWVFEGSSSHSFRQTMIHELGHVHGLHHNFDDLALMNYMSGPYRAFSFPYADDAGGIRAEYPSAALARTDLAVYLFRQTRSCFDGAYFYDCIADATQPSTVRAGDALTVNEYRVENAGTTTIATPTIEWYLTAARNYGSHYYALGTATYSSLAPFTYFTPSTVSKTFTVPIGVPPGNYYLAAFIREDGGISQSTFPFGNNFAFSREPITVTSASYPLSVSRHGTGAGTVTSAPAGISCGSVCSASFAPGSAVTLTATPASGSSFAGWSGACAGTGLCTVTMHSARSVGATFNGSSGDDYPDTWTAAAAGVLNGSIPSMINVPGDADWFRFDFPGPGTWTIRSTGTTDVVGYVYWPDGNRLYASHDDIDVGDYNFRMTIPIGAPASVYLKVVGSGSATGPYTLVSVFDDFPDVFSAAPSQPVNGSVSGSLAVEGDVDWFRFDFPGPGTWTIHSLGSIDLVGYAYAPDGVTLYGYDDDGAGYPNFSMTFPIGAATSVFVKVAGYAGVETGTYTLVSAFAADDYPNTFASAPSAGLNETLPATLYSDADADWFRFDFPGPGSWEVYTTGPTDTIGEAYAADGTTLYGSADNVDGLNFRLSFEVGAATSIFVRVRGRAPGPYTLVSSFSVPPPGDRASDFNRDGRSDILWRNTTTGQLYRMLMNGTTIVDGAMVYREPNTSWKVIGDAQFDGTAGADLLWRNEATGQVAMSLFNTSGLVMQSTAVMQETNLAWKLVGAPDFDGNGVGDLLWWNASSGIVWGMLTNHQAVAAQGFIHQEPNTSWRIVAVGDFAASGKRNQLLWRNTATGQVYLMTANWAAGFFAVEGRMIYQEPNLSWKVVAAADFNGDGRSDVLWRNEATGQVYLMLVNDAGVSGGALVYHEPNLAWKIVSTGDYNGDGRADLLWRNDTSGQVYMMLMNGFTIAQGALIYTEPNLAWRILGGPEYAIEAVKAAGAS